MHKTWVSSGVLNNGGNSPGLEQADVVKGEEEKFGEARKILNVAQLTS
jgi:hypothetical protein